MDNGKARTYADKVLLKIDSLKLFESLDGTPKVSARTSLKADLINTFSLLDEDPSKMPRQPMRTLRLNLDRIDASRGRSVDESIQLQPGESRGTDLAESISEIALRLRVDIFGPAGRE